MRGDTVIIRAFRDQARVLRVWGVTEEAVYACNKEQYQRRADGIQALDPVGFPRRDVFVYDAVLLEQLRAGTIQWSNLQTYAVPPGDAYLINGTVLRCLYCGERSTCEPHAKGRAFRCWKCGAEHSLE